MERLRSSAITGWACTALWAGGDAIQSARTDHRIGLIIAVIMVGLAVSSAIRAARTSADA